MRTLLEISREVRAIAQTGLAYCQDPYDRDRYTRLAAVGTEMLQEGYSMEDFRWPTETGYPTPKVDVRGFVIRDNLLLMVREATSGKWSVPGGWADVNLTPAENVEKECFEETGCAVRAKTLLSVVDRDRAGYPPFPEAIYKLHFLCDFLSGDPRPSFETTEAAFCSLDNLPELDLARLQPTDIKRAVEAHRTDERSTWFQKTS
jgi:ADP-ribose pyrophosphatase YjhB (NUDIX family)